MDDKTSQNFREKCSLQYYTWSLNTNLSDSPGNRKNAGYFSAGCPVRLTLLRPGRQSFVHCIGPVRYHLGTSTSFVGALLDVNVPRETAGPTELGSLPLITNFNYFVHHCMFFVQDVEIQPVLHAPISAWFVQAPKTVSLCFKSRAMLVPMKLLAAITSSYFPMQFSTGISEWKKLCSRSIILWDRTLARAYFTILVSWSCQLSVAPLT